MKTVSLCPRSWSTFRRRALPAFPHEYIEYLVGYETDAAYLVTAFVCVPHTATRTALYVDQKQVRDGRVLLGSIHTHPDAGSHPSESDNHGARVDGERLFGLYEIWTPPPPGAKPTCNSGRRNILSRSLVPWLCGLALSLSSLSATTVSGRIQTLTGHAGHAEHRRPVCAPKRRLEHPARRLARRPRLAARGLPAERVTLDRRHRSSRTSFIADIIFGHEQITGDTIGSTYFLVSVYRGHALL